MKTFIYTQIFILNIFLANFASAQDQEINILDFLPDVFERSLRTKVIDVFDNYYSFIYPVCANTFGTKIDKVDLETDLKFSSENPRHLFVCKMDNIDVAKGYELEHWLQERKSRLDKLTKNWGDEFPILDEAEYRFVQDEGSLRIDPVKESD